MKELLGWEENKILEYADKLKEVGDNWVETELRDKEAIINKGLVLEYTNYDSCDIHFSQKLDIKRMKIPFWWDNKDAPSKIDEKICVCKFCKKIFITKDTYEKFKNRGKFLCKISRQGILINDLTEEKIKERLHKKEQIDLCTIDKEQIKLLLDIKKKRAEIPLVLIDGKVKYENIPVYYSENTGCCYVYNETAKRLKEMGLILCRMYKATNIIEDNGDLNSLNTESIIHQFGYNVSASENLTSEQRKQILLTLLTNKIVSIEVLKNHLSFLINLNKDIKRMEYACKKWKNDFEFLDKLEEDKYELKKVSELKIKHRIIILSDEEIDSKALV